MTTTPDSTERALRESFESTWLAGSWSRKGTIDHEGDFIYDDDWVQGAYVAFAHFNRASLGAAQVPSLSDASAKKATHLISVCYFDKKGEADLFWKDIEIDQSFAMTVSVTPAQGKKLANVVWPCIEFPAALPQPSQQGQA